MNIDDFIDRWTVLHNRRKRAFHQGYAWSMIHLDHSSVVGFEHLEAMSRADRWSQIENRTESQIQQLIKEYRNANDPT